MTSKQACTWMRFAAKARTWAHRGFRQPRARQRHLTHLPQEQIRERWRTTAAAVLDLEGKPVGEILPVLDGWGLVLFYKPKKTGMNMIAIHQTDRGKRKDVPCAMVTGYK